MVRKEQDDKSHYTDDDVSVDEEEFTTKSATGEPSSPQDSFRPLCRGLSSAVVLCILIYGSLVYCLGGVNSLPKSLRGIIPNEPIFDKEDLGEQSVWDHTYGQGGLELTLINALDQEWYPYFNRAVQQWDSGTPDSLTLSTVTSDPDSECSPVSGFMKVCNGNYGKTGWEGINKIVLNNGRIDSSIALMNEYYFGKRDGNTRQYTMCHELGHGFGLAHSDGSMWNLNKGDCEYGDSLLVYLAALPYCDLTLTLRFALSIGMDYTNRPLYNKHPGAVNFKKLAAMYGIVGETTVSQSTNASRPQGDGSGLKQANVHRRDSQNLPLSVLEAMRAVDEKLLTKGPRRLHESTSQEYHEFNLGEGFVLKVHFLTS
jgi:hypothetical protein